MAIVEGREKCEDQHLCRFIIQPGNVNTMMPPMPGRAVALSATSFNAAA